MCRDSIAIREFFDTQYPRNRYSVNPADHTSFNGTVLRQVASRLAGRALGIGAGEGVDAIRLAKLGYEVDTVDMSAIACEKMVSFARAERVRLNVRNEPAQTADFSPDVYDVVIMNGLLHYVEDKIDLLDQARRCSALGALQSYRMLIRYWASRTEQ